MKTLHTNILGADYTVNVGKRKELELPKHLKGQCAPYIRVISVEHSMRDMNTKEERNKFTMGVVAHEVFHAFVKESGLDIPEDLEERLATWYEEHWRKMNNSIYGILDELNLLDI